MKYDIIIIGGGVAGLWLLNTLSDRGFNIILIEKDALGGMQTLASQGMIHGGQKYLLQGLSPQAVSIAKMPERWKACLEGMGEVDLRSVRLLSDAQVMWPAGALLSGIGVAGAAKLVNAKTKKLAPDARPFALKSQNLMGAVYELPEKVLDNKSLISALAEKHHSRIVQGEAHVGEDGEVEVSGRRMSAQLTIFVAGAGNEEVLAVLGAPKEASQRRALRQIMIKTMEHSLYGHGIVNNPKPRVTITSHPLAGGGYVWYVGGGIAERAAMMEEGGAILYAKKEMKELFPQINWTGKRWATHHVDRAEAHEPVGKLPDGPALKDYGNVVVAWPTKLTYAPALSDAALALIETKNLAPRYNDAPPALPEPPLGLYPWEKASWTD
jgi:glycine/D-amino acid oxidase-like deaminating enzyme